MNRKQRIAGLLKRFQFIDLSAAVSRTGSERERFLRDYADRRDGKYPTYEPFRSATGTIYGVSLGLDPSGPRSWPEIEAGVRRTCKGENEDMNLEAAKCLFDLVRAGPEASA